LRNRLRNGRIKKCSVRRENREGIIKYEPLEKKEKQYIIKNVNRRQKR
jgi:hypothetical protein